MADCCGLQNGICWAFIYEFQAICHIKAVKIYGGHFEKVVYHHFFYMSTIPDLNEKTQDLIQSKLQEANIPEPIQDKLGAFALLVIRNEIDTATKVFTLFENHSTLFFLTPSS